MAQCCRWPQRNSIPSPARAQGSRFPSEAQAARVLRRNSELSRYADRRALINVGRRGGYLHSEDLEGKVDGIVSSCLSAAITSLSRSEDLAHALYLCHFQSIEGSWPFVAHVQKPGHQALCPGAVALPSTPRICPFQKAAVTLPGCSLVSFCSAFQKFIFICSSPGSPAATQLAQEAWA